MEKKLAEINAKYHKCNYPPFEDSLSDILTDMKMDLETFHTLRTKPIKELTDLEIEQIKEIRDRVPKIKRAVVIQKIVSPIDIKKYLQGEYRDIRGFISKWQDASTFNSPEEYIRELGLTYPGSKFFDPIVENRPLDLNKDEDKSIMLNKVYVFRIKASLYAEQGYDAASGKIEAFLIPYGGNEETETERMKGIITQSRPFTGNGFTCSEKFAIPESFIVYDFPVPPQPFSSGDEIYEIEVGKAPHLYAVFSKRSGWKLIEKGTTINYE